MAHVTRTKPFPLYLLLLLHFFLGISALFGGATLIADPSGQLIRLPLEMIQGTPFPDYLIPGIILFLFNGLLPLLIFYSLLRRPDWRWAERVNLYPERHWAWTFSLYSGIILILWINVQLILIQSFTLLQPVYDLLGVAILICTLTPSVMNRFLK